MLPVTLDAGRAAAADRETASAMGIPVNTTNALVFAIGAGLAAAAGILAAPIVYVNPAMGGPVGLKGFAAFILGGAGSIPGAIVGGLVFGVLEAVYDMGQGLRRIGDLAPVDARV